MGMIQVVRDADFSGNGLNNILSPLPTLGGALYACYLPGNDWNGAVKALRDYSGQRGDLILGSAAINGVGIAAHATDPARTPFTSTDIASGTGAYTWIAVADITDSQGVYPLLSAAPGTIYSAVHISSTSGAVQVYKVSSGADNNAYSYPSTMRGAPAFIHGRWNATQTISGAVNPAAGWTGSAGYAVMSTSKTFLNANPIRALVADPGTVTAKLYLMAFYKGLLTDAQMEAVYRAARKVVALRGIAA